MTSNVVLSTEEFNVVGTRPIRHDGTDKVTGRARYSADINLPGLLYGAVLRSPHAHAWIRSIDPSRALALPGVKCVVSGTDFAEPSGKVADLAEGAIHNLGFLARNVMAKEKALYKGHAVAAVAATSLQIAEEALGLIDVEYEVLPPVTNAADAMKADAPILHERLANLSNPGLRPGGFKDEDDTAKSSNIANHFMLEVGDVEEGFKGADLVVEREFTTASVHQGYIEPHSATASWSEDGNITIWCGSQGQFTMRDQSARLLGIPASKVKVIPLEIGGGFGGKTIVYLEPIAGALAKKSGHPVKVSMSRTDVFQATGPTSGTKIRVKMGVTKDGRICAADATLIYESGAFPGSPAIPGSQCMFSNYDIPNARVEGLDVVVNKPKAAAYRAPGSPASAFAAESVIDELCEKLEMDPVEFRMLNGAQEGTRRVNGLRLPKVGFMEMLKAVKEHPHYSAPLVGPNKGRGIATGFWGNGTGPASATASINADGVVSLVEGSPDIGGSRVALAMHMAEVLGIPVEDIKPSVGDTDSVGYTSGTGGSGATFKSGWACYEVAQDIVRQMVERAAKIWEVTTEDVEYTDGVLTHKSDPELRLTFKQMAARLINTGGPITGRANVNPRGAGPACAATIVDVEVDPDTGKVDILRFTAIQDAGKAIHPSYVEGQIQGGAVQGIGWALNEEYVYNDKAEMANSSFLDYRMPTSLDLPMIDTVIVEVANPGHPYGLRGVGEVAIVPPMAAIANAIHNAMGVRLQQLPMSPGNVLEALWADGKNGNK